MSENIEILPLNAEIDIAPVEEIFFLTAAIKDFTSPESRERFKHKYFGVYLERYPDLVLIARHQGRVLGYCLGSPETTSFLEEQPHLVLFNDLYQGFPAHLHINLHPDAQGLGIGQKLILAWQEEISSRVNGMHIMTSPAARNTSFYRRLGFNFEAVRKYQNNDILFMGKNF